MYISGDRLIFCLLTDNITLIYSNIQYSAIAWQKTISLKTILSTCIQFVKKNCYTADNFEMDELMTAKTLIDLLKITRQSQ